MTINYTTLLGLAKPVTGTETGQWGDVVNDQITSLLEDAVANASTISVTAGNVTLSTTTGASNQARMSTLILTGTPGTTRNVVAPSQSKMYVVINQSDGAVVIKGSATTGVTVGAGQTAQVAWNGSDFVEIGNYVHGNFVVNGNLSVNGNSTLGDGGADTTTLNGQFIAANSNISKSTTLTTSVPALTWIKGATYTDTGTAGGTTQAHAPFNLISAPTLSTSNIVTYTNASTLYIAGAPSAGGSATITNPYSMYVAAGAAYLGGALTAASTVTLSGGTANGVLYLDGSKVATSGSALTFDGTNLGIGTSSPSYRLDAAITASGFPGRFATNSGTAANDAGVLFQTIPSATAATRTAAIYLDANGANASGGDYFYLGMTGALDAEVTNQAAGPIIFKTTGSERMRLDSSGNLGLGVTPSASTYKTLEIGATGNSITGLSGETDYATNAYYGSAAWRYGASGVAATRYQQYAGQHIWFTAPSGTAGNTISFTQAMTLDSSGNLGIGTSSPTVITAGSRVLEVSGAGDYFPSINLARTGASGYTNVNWKQFLSSDGGLYFRQNSTDRMVLDSSGNLGLGVTPSAWTTNYKAVQIGSAGVSMLGGSVGVATFAQFGNNYYYDGTNYRYTSTANANYINMANGEFAWHTAPSGTAGNAISFTQAMTLDASGNLAMGSSASSARIVLTQPSGDGTVKVSGDGTNYGFWRATSSTQFDLGTASALPVTFYTNGNERARITSGGDLLVGTTSGSFSQVLKNGTYAFGVAQTGVGNNVLLVDGAYTSGTQNLVVFAATGTATGTITYNGSAVAYNTTSDYRLKDNPQPLTGSGAFIDALQPKTWNWKTDGSRGVGFIAHEAQAVSPGSVVGEKDAVDEDGKPVMQAMEYGSAEFIANIIAELQSLRARVAALEAQP